MESLNWNGIVIGAAAFIIITFLYWVTIKAEYLFSKRFWVVFLALGLGTALLSLFIDSLAGSSISSIFGFTSLWAIGEILDQEKRVVNGRFPMNPRRKAEYERAAKRMKDKG